MQSLFGENTPIEVKGGKSEIQVTEVTWHEYGLLDLTQDL